MVGGALSASSSPHEKLLPTCTVVVPCYLPNEEAIVLDTATRALGNAHAGKVVVVYNTPRPMAETETALRELEARSEGRFVSAHVRDSTSKAENVVYALQHHVTTEAVLLLDADHHISDESLRDLLQELRSAPEAIVCVQGSVVVRGSTCFARCLDALGHLGGLFVQPTLQFVAGSALFVGAGAVWRADVLRSYGLTRPTAEDSDLTFRLLADHKTVRASVRGWVSELPPCGAVELLRQRLRWTSGFDDAACDHWRLMVCRNPRALGILLYVYGTYVLTLANVAAGLVAMHHPPSVAALVAHATTASGVLLLLGIFLLRTVHGVLRRKRARLALAIAVCPLYAGMQTVLFLVSCAKRLRHPRTVPHVTRRAVAPPQKEEARV